MIEELPSNVKSTSHDQSDDVAFSELHAVAINGTKAQIQALLAEYHYDIDKGDQMGRTPLMYSVLGDRINCAEALLKGGADVLKGDIDERSALHWASYQGNHKMVKLLLTRGALVNSQDKEGRTPLHLATSHLNLKVMQLLLRDQNVDVDRSDGTGMTALHWCVSYGHVEHVKMLLKSKATVNCLDKEKKTVLHWASNNKDTIIVRMLVEYDQLILNCKDSEGRTPLHLACGAKNEELVKFLINEECSIDEQDNLGRTPLHWAAVLGYTGIVKLLLRRRADFDIPDQHGVRALHYAAQNNFTETVDAMLQFGHVKDVPDYEGRTAVLWAAGKGACDALVVLMKHGQDVLATDSTGTSALHMAAYGGHVNCVRVLLEKSASVNVADSHQLTPLFYAAQMGHTEVAKVLVDHSAAVDIEDQEGRTPLHWAALGGRTDFCEILVSRGLDPNKRDNLGRPALHCASYGGFVTCMQLLLDSGADIDAQDNAGVSALHWACASGSLDAVKLLFKRNAFPNFMETDGENLTPLDYAIIGDHQDIAQFMIEREAFTIADIQDTAATAIQSTWRGYNTRKLFKETKELLQLHEQKRKESKQKAFQDETTGSLSSINASFGSENEGCDGDANSDCLMCGAPEDEEERLETPFGKEGSIERLERQGDQKFEIVQTKEKSVPDRAKFRESISEAIEKLTLKKSFQREESPADMRRLARNTVTSAYVKESDDMVQLETDGKGRRASLPLETLRYLQRKTLSGNIDEIPETISEAEAGSHVPTHRYSSTYHLLDRGRRSSRVKVTVNNRRSSDLSHVTHKSMFDRLNSGRPASSYRLSDRIRLDGNDDRSDNIHDAGSMGRFRGISEGSGGHAGGTSQLNIELTPTGRITSDARNTPSSNLAHVQSNSQPTTALEVAADYSRRDSSAYSSSLSRSLWPPDSGRVASRTASPLPRDQEGTAETSEIKGSGDNVTSGHVTTGRSYHMTSASWEPAHDGSFVQDAAIQPLQESAREASNPEMFHFDNINTGTSSSQNRPSDDSLGSHFSSSRGNLVDKGFGGTRLRHYTAFDRQGRPSHFQYGHSLRDNYLHRRMSSVEFSSRQNEFTFLPPNVEIAYNLRRGVAMPYGVGRAERRISAFHVHGQGEDSESSLGASQSTSSHSERAGASEPSCALRIRKLAVDIREGKGIARKESGTVSPFLTSWETLSTCGKKLAPWEQHKRENLRVQIIRQKTEAAVRIQRAFRKYNEKKRRSTGAFRFRTEQEHIPVISRPFGTIPTRREVKRQFADVKKRSPTSVGSSSETYEKKQLEKNQTDREIAALTIQLVWRKYVRRRLIRENEERSREIVMQQLKQMRLLSKQEKRPKSQREKGTKKRMSPPQPSRSPAAQSELSALTREISLSLNKLLAEKGAIPKLKQPHGSERHQGKSTRHAKSHSARQDPPRTNELMLLDLPVRRKPGKDQSRPKTDEFSFHESHGFNSGRMWSSNLRKKPGPRR